MVRPLLIVSIGLLAVQADAQTLDLALVPPASAPLISSIKAKTLADGGFLAGVLNGDGTVNVLRIDQWGMSLWNKSLAPPYSDVSTAVVDLGELPNGNTYLMLALPDYSWTVANRYGLLVFAPDGMIVSSKQYDYSSDATLQGDYSTLTSRIVPLAGGRLLLNIASYSRTILTELDMDGSAMWSKSYVAAVDSTYPKEPSFDVQLTQDSGVIVCGKDRNWPYVMRMNAGGDMLWCKAYQGVADYSHWRHIRELPNGEFMLVGNSDDQAVVARISGTGELLWARHTYSMFYPESIVGLGNGQYLAVDVYTNSYMRFDTEGNILATWASAGTVFGSTLIGTWNGSLDMATRVPEAGIGIYRPAIIRSAGAEPWNCASSAVIPVESTLMTTANGLVPLEEGVQYAQPVVVTDLFMEAEDVTWNTASACYVLTGIAEAPDLVSSVFPSPVTSGDLISVSFDRTLIEPSYQLMDASGRAVSARKSASAPSLSIPTQGIGAGLYAIRLFEGSNLIGTKRVVVQ